jgi:hypothetical protein
MQFMWRCVTSDFVALGPYYPSDTGLSSHSLHACFWDAVGWYERYSFKVILVCCDAATASVAFLNELGVTGDKPWFANTYSGLRCYVYFDPVHQLKIMRNLLFNSRPGGTRNLHIRGKPLSWASIRRCRDRDVTRLQGMQWQLIPKLTDQVVNLNNWTKMRVHLAKVRVNIFLSATHPSSNIGL